VTASVAVPSPPPGGSAHDAPFEHGTVRGNPRVAGRWWTEVDQAECDVLVYALVRGVFRHRERCAACARSGSAVYCGSVNRAIEELLEWLQLRSLLSHAEYLAAQKHVRQVGRVS
jgi:hypothetical protein